MKFKISRTSIWDSEIYCIRPCEEAEEMFIPFWHTRTCTEEFFDTHFSQREGLWRSKGKNHKNISARSDGLSKENWITRQEDDRKVWGIEVTGLQDLLGLIKKYGALVIDSVDDSGNEEVFEIEIYDTYRE